MKIIDRTLTIQTNLTKMAEELGYKIEVDSFDDVYHEGYSSSSIKNQSVSFKDKKMSDAEQLFSRQAATALEDAERDSYATAIRKARINALEQALLKIDLIGGGCEYIDLENNSIQAKAGIISVEVDEKNDLINIEIKNPEHLINCIIGGVGLMHPPLPSDEESSTTEILAHIHHLNRYFDVFGESKPSGDLDGHFCPDINEEYFQDLVKENIKNLTLDEVSECVTECIEDEEISEKRCFELVEYLTEFKKKEIKCKILELKTNELDKWKNI
jgi:hypothetical protein